MTRPKHCGRCGATEKLEEDHIIPRSKGGSDAKKNKRMFCQGCHDYRHAHDGALEEIEKEKRRLESPPEHPENFYPSGLGNEGRLAMWIWRLGVIEAYNTPELIRERGYKPYWDINSTHYSYWVPEIRRHRKSQSITMVRGETIIQTTLLAPMLDAT